VTASDAGAASRRLIVQVDLPVGSTFREARDDEAREAAGLRSRISALRVKLDETRAELDMLERSCRHAVVYDEDGYPYASRTCLACSKVTNVL